MSSELTIDIQLTELGFTSWDFQLLKQETPQTCDSASALEASAVPSPLTSVENHVDEPPSASVSLPTNSFPSSEDCQMTTDNNQNKNTSAPTGHDYPSEGQKTKKGSDSDDDDDIGGSVNDDDDDDKELEDENRRTKKSNKTDINDEEEDEDDDFTEEEGDLSSDTNDSEEHRCHVCDLVFSTAFLLREHMHVHTGVRPYCCVECGKQFCHLANYRAHLRSHNISCLICSARFATQQLLQDHLDTNHFENEFYQCDFCKRIFVSMEECEKHVETHKQEVKRYPCPHCDRAFHHRPSLHRHIKWHNKNALICTDCGQAFSRKIALLRHSFIHLGLLPYTCVHCKRHFRLPSLYQKHQCKPDHIQCVACLVVFQSQDDFEKHKKATGCWGHQMTSPANMSDIRCMECGEIFDSSEKLKKHAGTHQRVMKCSECGMGFRSSLMLMSHMGGHAAQRPCLCKECGLGFPHQHAYDSHLKMCGTVTTPKVAGKKPKKKVPPCPEKTEMIIAHKIKVFQTVSPDPQNRVSYGVPLQSISLVGKQKQPSEGQWTLVVNKEHIPGPVPLVMFLTPPITSASEDIQNPQNLISSRTSEKHLPLPHATDVPLASTSKVADVNKSVLVKGLPSNPTANILIPLTTNVNSSEMRWTVLEDQCTSPSVSDMHTITKENERVMHQIESKGTLKVLNVNAENEQKSKAFSSLEILNTMQKKDADETKPNVLALSSSELHNPETPLCLIKVKSEPNDEYRQQRGSEPEEKYSVETAEVKSGTPLTTKVHNFDTEMSKVSVPSEVAADISQIKKEPKPQEEHNHSIEVHPNSDLISPHRSDVVNEDVVQCEICGIVLLERNRIHHSMEHSVVLKSTPVFSSKTLSLAGSVPHFSPPSSPSSPPCKRLNLG